MSHTTPGTAGHHDADKAGSLARNAAKAVGAAALQAAVFAGVRAGVDRAGARAFERTTGVWPGEKAPDRT